MKQEIKNFLTALDNKQLYEAVREIQQNSEQGFIKEDGYVRQLAAIMVRNPTSDTTGESSALIFSEVHLLREAAYRWADIQNFYFCTKDERTNLFGRVHPLTCDRHHPDCEVNQVPRDFSKDGALVKNEDYELVCPCGHYKQ